MIEIKGGDVDAFWATDQRETNKDLQTDSTGSPVLLTVR